jgi:phosphoesterase RecJ-like protein
VTSSDWRIDPAAADAALELLREAKLVLMPTHQNVDADGLASPLALMHALHQLGVRAVPLISDGNMASSLKFLPGVDKVLIYGEDPLPDYDLLCLTDCSDRRRLGAFYEDDPSRIEGGAVPIINIDHHVTNDRFGVVNIVEPDASSSAEVVAVLLNLWETDLTRPIAQCLLAGIYGDTLGLRTDSTTSRTMRTAADLVDAGAEPRPIVEALFQRKPRSTVCVWEHALRAVKWTGTLIWTEVTQDVLSRCGAKASEAEGLVNFLAGTDGSRAAAILYETDQGWRVSLRSLRDDVDVAMIAAHFGGGGHPRAAGCTIIGGEEAKDAFLEQVAELALSQDPVST